MGRIRKDYSKIEGVQRYSYFREESIARTGVEEKVEKLTNVKAGDKEEVVGKMEKELR